MPIKLGHFLTAVCDGFGAVKSVLLELVQVEKKGVEVTSIRSAEEDKDSDDLPVENAGDSSDDERRRRNDNSRESGNQVVGSARQVEDCWTASLRCSVAGMGTVVDAAIELWDFLLHENVASQYVYFSDEQPVKNSSQMDTSGDDDQRKKRFDGRHISNDLSVLCVGSLLKYVTLASFQFGLFFSLSPSS